MRLTTVNTAEKQELIVVGQITRWIRPNKRLKPGLLAVPAVPTVVNSLFQA
jgi:hypothetical protein